MPKAERTRSRAVAQADDLVDRLRGAIPPRGRTEQRMFGVSDS